jgi:hypothetical protein
METRAGEAHEGGTRGREAHEGGRHLREGGTRGREAHEGGRHLREGGTRGREAHEGGRHSREGGTRGRHTREAHEGGRPSRQRILDTEQRSQRSKRNGWLLISALSGSAAGGARSAREGGSGIPENTSGNGSIRLRFPGSQSHPPAGLRLGASGRPQRVKRGHSVFLRELRCSVLRSVNSMASQSSNSL